MLDRIRSDFIYDQSRSYCDFGGKG
jgi:hypothetical protein